MPDTSITAEAFLAQATGLSLAQRSAISALNLLGAKPYSRWMALALEAAEGELNDWPVTLSKIAPQLGLSSDDADRISARFGDAPRKASVWSALARQYLTNPDAWRSSCSTQGLPAPQDDYDIGLSDIAGEGYLTRYGGRYKFTSTEEAEKRWPAEGLSLRLEQDGVVGLPNPHGVRLRHATVHVVSGAVARAIKGILPDDGVILFERDLEMMNSEEYAEYTVMRLPEFGPTYLRVEFEVGV